MGRPRFASFSRLSPLQYFRRWPRFTLFAFVYHWNSYLWPLTVLEGNTQQYPIVVSLSRLLSYNRGAMNTGFVMAALAVLPPVLLFVLLQRFFVDSIVASGING